MEITEAELLVACGSLLWAFEMRPNLDKSGQPMWPDPDHWTSNVIGGPLPITFDLHCRSEDRKNVITQLYEESLHSDLE